MWLSEVQGSGCNTESMKPVAILLPASAILVSHVCPHRTNFGVSDLLAHGAYNLLLRGACGESFCGTVMKQGTDLSIMLFFNYFKLAYKIMCFIVALNTYI